MTASAGTLTLTEFLTARLAADEERARFAQAIYDRNEPMPARLLGVYLNPARVLAEVEAKRRVVAYCKPMLGWGDDNPHEVRTATAILSMLALPYASHPDYREEWRP